MKRSTLGELGERVEEGRTLKLPHLFIYLYSGLHVVREFILCVRMSSKYRPQWKSKIWRHFQNDIQPRTLSRV